MLAKVAKNNLCSKFLYNRYHVIRRHWNCHKDNANGAEYGNKGRDVTSIDVG